jgi:hypothetical protein
MKAIGSILVVMAVALVVIALSVFAGHDTSVLVAPADAVAETFVRELGMARYGLARNYLARNVKEQVSAEQMRADVEPLRQGTGKPDQVVTSLSSRTDERARVLATIEGRTGNAALYVDLIREAGVWKVAAWPLDIVQRP